MPVSSSTLRRRRIGRAAVGLSLLVPVGLQAQRPRDQLISRAFDEADPDRRIEVLVSAANPQLGPPDGVWALGIRVLVQSLLDRGQASLGSLWARWAVRLSAGTPIDTLEFLPAMTATFYHARQFVNASADPDPGVVETTWQWPMGTLARERLGFIRVAPSASVPVRVRVQGLGFLDPGGQLRLPAGSHVVEAIAEGYDTVRVTREVLPGVITLLTFTPRPLTDVLATDAEAAALRSVVRIVTRRLGETRCATGFFAGRDGLVVTTYRAIRGAEQVSLETADGRRAPDVQLASYDIDRDVAVLHGPITSSDTLALANAVSDGDVVWAVRRPDCGAPASVQTRIAEWRDRPQGLLRLANELTGIEQGGPLIAAAGTVVGLGTDDSTAVPGLRVPALLEEARRNVRAGALAHALEVAGRESHLYGVIRLESSIPNAVARITPLEIWHGPQDARADSLPFTFVGPMGDYRAELVVNDEVLSDSILTVRRGVTTQVAPLDLPRRVAQAPRRGGQFPWAVAAVIGVLGAAGGVVGLALSGGGDGDDERNGRITFTFPPGVP